MRISLNWLKDYVDIKPEVSIQQIGNILTLAGLEVEGIERLDDKCREFILGVVKDAREPKEGKLIYDVKVNEKTFSICSDKSSIPVGMVVALKSLESEKNIFSFATYADLGFSLGASDIILLPNDKSEIPKNLSLVKEFNDVIFTLSITPNRADALSHLGISRELCALLDLSARLPMLVPKEMAGPTHEKVAVEIENADDCPRYACRVIENIVVRESPYWIKLKLLSCGIRPINNVVDVTNYVMLSRGQPLHAFDYEKLFFDNARAKVIVRRALEGEIFVALDGRELLLSASDVVIADPIKVLALAGVIGGQNSAISKDTKTILIESAYFDSKNVRMAARRHGLITESSYRFERGCDPNGVVDALNYAASLLLEITDAKVCREPIDAYRKRIDPLELKMRPERAQAVLGVDEKDFDQDLLRRRFLRLGIETVAKRGDAIYFRVPTHRPDLSREIDLIEEAARMIGLDKVKETAVRQGIDVDEFSNKKLESIVERLCRSLVIRGFSEVVNYGFLNKEFQARFLGEKDEQDLIEIKNPLSDRYGVMRQSLIPGLIKNLLHNQRNQEKTVELFEVGTVFLGKRKGGEKPNPKALFGSLDQDSYCIEKKSIAGVMAGKSTFYAFDHPTSFLDFYHLKGVLSEALQNLGFCEQFPNVTMIFEHGAKSRYFHPGESATIVHLDQHGAQTTIGFLGKLHPETASTVDLVGDAYLFELDIEKLANLVPEMPKFKPFSRFPSIERDVAFLVDEEVRVDDILRSVKAVRDAETKLLGIRVFDIYRGKNIEAGKKSVAISMALQRDDRTLTDEEADQFVKDFVSVAERETGAKVR